MLLNFGAESEQLQGEISATPVAKAHQGYGAHLEI